MRKLFIILIIALFLISACSEQPAPKKSIAAKKSITEPLPEPEPQINVKRMLSSETEQMRIATYATCQNLINQTVTIKGRVLFEECGKHQLGGAPGSGPAYCYYGIQSDNCLVYYESQIDGGDRFPQANKIINVLNQNQQVELEGKVILFKGYNCNPATQIPKSECSYFILE